MLDNTPHLVRVPAGSGETLAAGELITLDGQGSGFEDITFHANEEHWYCLTEAARSTDGKWMPHVDVFDRQFDSVESFWLDFAVESDNKGFEGLAWLRYQGGRHLVALCEGNECKDGKAGRKPGNGRLQLFRREPGRWPHIGTIKLPASVRFEDYAGLDIRGRQVTVLSQEASAIWIGHMRADAENLDDLWEDNGLILPFPRGADGRILYCNLEGITWIDERTIAVVSDKAKAGKQHDDCKAKDQSVHLFRVTMP